MTNSNSALLALAERVEAHAAYLVGHALNGYGDLSIGREARRANLKEAADAFTCAAALRARSAQ